MEVEYSPTGFSMLTFQVEEIANTIYKIPNANVLVFGCGADSDIYAVASSGNAVFIDDSPYYVSACMHETYLVEYPTSVGVWAKEEFPPGFPEFVKDIAWDVIVVDGPRGYSWDCPGRQLPIYIASLWRRRATIYVHDYEREWERKCCDKYLMPNPSIYGVGSKVLAKFKEGTYGLDG